MKSIAGIIGRFLMILSIVLIFSQPVYAYIDPGTGSMLIQAVIAIVAATSVFLGMFWGRVKQFLNKVVGKKQVSGEQRNDGHE